MNIDNEDYKPLRSVPNTYQHNESTGFEKIKDNIEVMLMHSELRLKQAQSIAHIGSWELDLATGVLLWSEETCRIFGVDSTECIQTYTSWLSFIHPDDREYVNTVSKEGKESLSNVSFHHRIIRKDGEVRHIFSKTQFEFNAEGAAICLYGIAHDVTENIIAEQALKRSEANLRVIVDLMPQYIFVKDISGHFTFVNKSFSALYGLTPDELIGRSANGTLPLRSETACFLKQDAEVVLLKEKRMFLDQPVTDELGNKRFFNTLKVPYVPFGDNATMVLGIANDITEQTLAEKERKRMTEEIMQRNKDLEKFSYIVSHNLRAPIANIIGISDILHMPELGSDDRKEFIDKLGGCIGQLNDIVNDLNEILQVEYKENKTKEWVSLSDILSDVEITFASLIKKDHVKILSDFSAVGEIFTIKSYMYSIFFNLVSNSIKFRRADTTPIIKIYTQKINGNVIIIFKDNGLGIDLDKKSNQVFGLYKRFHFHVDGKGIGLFMVKAQTESLRGKISVSSKVNKGAEFKLEFSQD